MMWWIQTTGYHLAGLVWLIVIAAIFLIAIVAIGTAGAAAGSARRTRRMMREHDSYHMTAGGMPGLPPETRPINMGGPVNMGDTAVRRTSSGVVPPSPPAPQGRDSPVVEAKPRGSDSNLGDSMRILHERYARGEITREEYLRAREDMMTLTR